MHRGRIDNRGYFTSSEKPDKIQKKSYTRQLSLSIRINQMDSLSGSSERSKKVC